MIVVDTSIWIEFFKRNEPVFTILRELIETGNILGHEAVFGELLQGCLNSKELNFILKYWELLKTKEYSNIFIDAGILSFENKHIHKGIGLIDSVVITLARKYEYKVWTLDQKLLKTLKKHEIFSI